MSRRLPLLFLVSAEDKFSAFSKPNQYATAVLEKVSLLYEMNLTLEISACVCVCVCGFYQNFSEDVELPVAFENDLLSGEERSAMKVSLMTLLRTL